MRRLILVALLCAASADAAEFVQAVDFPYRNHPRRLWERELVWLKNIGIRTVAFSGARAPSPGDPRDDLPGLLQILRRLNLRGWMYGAAPETVAALEPHFESHGGPIAYIEGSAAMSPPAPVTRLSALSPESLARSREIFAAGHGSLLWLDVEDSLAPGLRRGVVSFAGTERPGSAALRRDAALLRFWAAILPNLAARRKVDAKIPAVQLLSKGPHGASAVSISNPGPEPFAGPIQALDPAAGRNLMIPRVEVPAGQSLWLPVNVPLAAGGLCEDCAAFAPRDRIVYATAELHAIEYENGILACEFSAPAEGEVVIQLSRTPSGPFIADGHPADFEWDPKNSAVRLRVPAGKGALHRVRVGLATEPPDSSAFFAGASRLILGKPNLIATTYSSEALANRSRLLAPPGFRVRVVSKSAMQIDYEITPPAGAPRESTHGEFVTLALEADGVRLGRARVQLFRPASLRIVDAAALRLGPEAQVPIDPPLVTFDPRAGRELRLALRNNYPSIQTYTIEASGPGLSFLPARSEISIAPMAERELTLRVFSDEPGAAPRDAIIKVGGAADFEQRIHAVPIPRGQSVAYARDLDGDGRSDFILENQRVRASFSGLDGRWMEWVWKDTGTNLLPESGALAAGGPVEGRASGSGWELRAPKGRRTVRLAPGDRLTIEQDQPLPPEILASGSRDGVVLTVERSQPNRAAYALERAR